MFPAIFAKEFGFVTLSLGAEPNYELPPEECKLLNSTTAEKRRQQFVSGRVAAHMALERIGVMGREPILRDDRGLPIWPTGIVGSITHCGEWAMALVTKVRYAQGVGIDLEDFSARSSLHLAQRICTDRELAWVTSHRASEQQSALITIFSAKESVFKAIYPQCRRYFGFQDAEITHTDQDEIFQGTLLVDLGEQYSAGFSFRVESMRNESHVFTVVIT